MHRRIFLKTSGIAAALVSPLARSSSLFVSPPPIKNIVLVHGLFADGSCWSDVIGRLQRLGFNATAVQNPLTTLEDACTETMRVLKEQDGPTVLVGHSFAGVIVSQTGVFENVRSLVYIAARAPDANEDYAALAKTFPTSPASAGISFDGDVGRLQEAAFLNDFANGVPEERARILYATQQPFHKALVAAKTTEAAWRSKPSFYAVSAEDRTINPELERFLAKRMRAQTIEIRSGHLSMVTHPGDVASLIVRASSI